MGLGPSSLAPTAGGAVLAKMRPKSLTIDGTPTFAALWIVLPPTLAAAMLVGATTATRRSNSEP